MTKKTNIIIGLSAAGIGALTKLRSFDKESRVIAICAEKELPYNKCFLADYVSNNKTEQAVHTKQLSFFTDNNIEVFFDTRVTRIVSEQKAIQLHNGQQLFYDQLFIGTGLTPLVPSLEGVDAQGVFTFQTLADTNNILKFIHMNKPKTAVVIGAGLTGLELADALMLTGIQVHVLEMGPRVLARIVDEGGSIAIQRAMAHCGVNAVLASRVHKVTTVNDVVDGVVLENGTKIACQLVVLAIGAGVDKQLFIDSGLEFAGKALKTNDYLQTNIPSIWAAGDVAIVKDQLTGTPVQNCTWPDAVMQGMIAGSCMAGVMKPYPGATVIHSSHFFGLDFVTCGALAAPLSTYQVVTHHQDKGYYQFLLDEHNHLKGFAMIGTLVALSPIKRALLTKEVLSVEHILSLVS